MKHRSSIDNVKHTLFWSLTLSVRSVIAGVGFPNEEKETFLFGGEVKASDDQKDLVPEFFRILGGDDEPAAIVQ